MDTFGIRMYLPGLLLIAQTAIGYSPMQDGPGFPITHGDGRLFITVAGFMTVITDGFGLRTMNGDRVGLPGEDPMTIMDGRQSAPVSALILRMEAGTMYLTINGPL